MKIHDIAVGTTLALCLIASTVSTGESETIRKIINVNLFYPPEGTQNGHGVPNWYYYWKQGNVVEGLQAFEYNNKSYFGEFEPVQFKLFVGNSAPGESGTTHIVKNKFSNETFEIGANGRGIDCCALVCAHEAKHMRLFEILRSTTAADSDRDGISDWDETHTYSEYHFNPIEPDTYDLATKIDRDYASYGDNEFLARMAEKQPYPVYPAKDWSVHGKNWKE
jgi:hypothetical protein